MNVSLIFQMILRFDWLSNDAATLYYKSVVICFNIHFLKISYIVQSISI